MTTSRRGFLRLAGLGALAAGAVITMIPCVVLYVALQRFYVAGLASDAVKG